MPARCGLVSFNAKRSIKSASEIDSSVVPETDDNGSATAVASDNGSATAETGDDGSATVVYDPTTADICRNPNKK
ncbi:unnamed protein product [Rotaria socialis]|uniref:Uncharacterized protein n=1 Tax=Rotaria socialis TaxID=392032 RepID=A0A819A1E6_9BILA|nr:unnamed protein product [Rotaria socialis]